MQNDKDIEVTTWKDTHDPVSAANSEPVKEPVVETKEVPAAPATDNAASEKAPESAPVETETEVTPDAKDASAGEAGSEVESAPGEARKKPGKLQRRLNKMTAKTTALEEAVRVRDLELAQLRQGKQQPPSQPPAPAAQRPPGKPSADQFDSHENFIEALTDWKMDQREATRNAQYQQAAANQQVKTEAQKYLERVETFSKGHDDYKEIVEEIDQAYLTPVIEKLFIESEVGPEMVYELGNNKKELARIAAMPPHRQAVEIGKIEDRFLKARTEKTKPNRTSAPAPIVPISAASKGGSGDPRTWDQDTYEAKRKAGWGR